MNEAWKLQLNRATYSAAVEDPDAPAVEAEAVRSDACCKSITASTSLSMSLRISATVAKLEAEIMKIHQITLRNARRSKAILMTM